MPHGIPSLSDINITTDIILDKLTNLNSAKSPGPDGWPPFVLKEIAQHICLPLYIISNSLATGCVPDNWKRGHVVIIYKKGCRKQASNYHPITLTSIIGKLLESIVRDSLLTHFNTHDLLSNNQHGFIPERSCVTQLLSVLDDWTRAMMEGHNTDVVYFDFSKAFDNCPSQASHTQIQGLWHWEEAFGVATEFSFRSRTECCHQFYFFLPGDLLLVVFLKALYWAHYYLQYMLMTSP